MEQSSFRHGRALRLLIFVLFFASSGMSVAKPHAVQMRVAPVSAVLSDDASCKQISENYASSMNERFRRFADQIGGQLAPNGRIILCEFPDVHRKYGSAFAFALRDGITTHAWGIALHSVLIFSSSDDELRGLIAHEIGHNATGYGSCDHLRRDRYRKCEQSIDDYGASLVGSCPMLRMLEAIRRDEKNLPAESEDALRKRIFHMYALCKPTDQEERKILRPKKQKTMSGVMRAVDPATQKRPTTVGR